MARAWPIPQLRLDDPVRLALARIVRTRTRELYSHMPGVFSAADAEAVHDLRVSSRRLQTVLTVFNAWMPGKTARRISKRLKPAIRALGAIRERHMIAQVAQRLAGGESALQTVAVGLFIARYRQGAAMCGIEVAPVIRETFSDELQELLRELSQRLERSCNRAHRSREVTFADAVPRALEPVLERVAACTVAVSDIGRCVEELHRLRVAAKPLRYTMELLEPLCDRAFRTQYQRIRSAVQVLGDLHDLDVAITAMRAHVAEMRLYNRTASATHRIPAAPLDRLVADARRRRDALGKEFAAALEWLRRENFARDIFDSLD
jgi:CHAD domain-containing protein